MTPTCTPWSLSGDATARTLARVWPRFVRVGTAVAAVLALLLGIAPVPAEAVRPSPRRPAVEQSDPDLPAYPETVCPAAPKPATPRALTRKEAAALVERFIQYLRQHPEARASVAPDTKGLAAEVEQAKAQAQKVSADTAALRDDLEYHLGQERQEQERPGRTSLFGVGQLSYTMTGNESRFGPLLRFPYDYDQTALAGVSGVSGHGKGFFGVDFYKLGLSSVFSARCRLVAVLGAESGGQANNDFANGFELGAPTFQGQTVFFELKDVIHDLLDLKAGYHWLPWGREVQGLLRLNPYFNSNSFFYRNGFSQSENQTGLFLQTRNHSRLQYGFGLTSGDAAFSLPAAQAEAHAGEFAWQRTLAADNSRLGRYGSVQGFFNRFTWNLDFFDNGGETGVFRRRDWSGGFSWAAHERLLLMGELGLGDVRHSTGANSDWDAYYTSMVWRLTCETDLALRYDHATVDDGPGSQRTVTGRTLSVVRRFGEGQKLICDFSNPSSNPGFKTSSPVLFAGRDVNDDLFRLSYRLEF